MIDVETQEVEAPNSTTDWLRRAKELITWAWYPEIPNGHCAYSALVHAYNKNQIDDAKKFVEGPLGFESITDLFRWNDSHTKEEVIDLFDRAILKASE